MNTLLCEVQHSGYTVLQILGMHIAQLLMGLAHQSGVSESLKKSESLMAAVVGTDHYT